MPWGRIYFVTHQLIATHWYSTKSMEDDSVLRLWILIRLSTIFEIPHPKYWSFLSRFIILSHWNYYTFKSAWTFCTGAYGFSIPRLFFPVEWARLTASCASAITHVLIWAGNVRRTKFSKSFTVFGWHEHKLSKSFKSNSSQYFIASALILILGVKPTSWQI